MIELLGVGVPRAGGGWLLHRVCGSVDRGELVVVVSRDPDERRALLDAVTGRQVAEEGRAWVSRIPVLRDTRIRLRSVVAEVSPGRPLVEGRSVLWNTLALPAPGWGGLPGFLRLPRSAERRAAVRALGRVGLAGDVHRDVAQLDGEARVRLHLARELAREPEYVIVHELDALLDARAAARVLAMVRDLARTQRLAVMVSMASLALAPAAADRILAIADGLLVFEGPPGDVSEPMLDGRMGAIAPS